MVYNALHGQIIEKEWDQVRNVLMKDVTGKMVKQKTVNGDLPLHMSLKARAPTDVLMKVIKAYPVAVIIPSSDGETPLNIAERLYITKDVRDILKELEMKQVAAKNGSQKIVTRWSSFEVVLNKRAKEAAKREEPATTKRRTYSRKVSSDFEHMLRDLSDTRARRSAIQY